MQYDSQTAFLPADPSQGLPARVVPRIVVHPYRPPDEASNYPAGSVESDGYPYDWIALPSPSAADAAQPAPSPQPAPYGDGYPNDWITLPATPGTPQPAPSPQPSSPSPMTSNRPAPRPDPFTDYWSRVPANHLTQFAWHPPIFPDSLGRYPSAVPAPAPVDMSPLAGYGLLGGLAHLQRTPAGPPAGGLLRPLLQPPTVGQAVSQFGLFGALLPGVSNNPPSLLNEPPQSSLAAPSSIDASSAPSLIDRWIDLAAGGLSDPPGPVTEPNPPPGGGSLATNAQAASTPMPGLLGAALQGFESATRQLAQTRQSIPGLPTIADDDSPAAQPFAWSDLASPLSQAGPKIVYRLAESYPTTTAGVVGGFVGGKIGRAVGPYGALAGTIIGGSLGSAALSAAQTLGPAFAAELQKSPNDPEGAWNRARTQAAISGVFSGASWAAFPARFFEGPVKHLLFQSFGVQPVLSAIRRSTENVVEGKPIGEGLGEAYGEGVVNSVPTALGHAAVNGIPARFGSRPAEAPPPPPSVNAGRPAALSAEARGAAESPESTIPTRSSSPEVLPASTTEEPIKSGSLSIRDWSGYPEYVRRPKGPATFLEGAEYKASRRVANRVNRKRRKADPETHKGYQIHEMLPVKFGGSPDDLSNKILLSPEDHYRVSEWWMKHQRYVEQANTKPRKNPKNPKKPR